MHAKTLMIQGTASTVGKSTLVTGLCRLFAQEGLKVAPFKAQNMSLNSWVTLSGGEIGRAQAVQAEAAGIEPTVEMNPILLKPEGMSRSQVILLGRPYKTLEVQAYYRHLADLRLTVQQALQVLREKYDLVIIEGAGSPVELNLMHRDLVNMAVARMADAPVILVGDIDRGGIFASLLGTLMLLAPEDRARVKGLIVNKFRGDRALWHDGERLLADMGKIPVLGTLPFYDHIRIAEEDIVALDDGTASLLRSQQQTSATNRHLKIVIVRLPYMSNYDEFDALAAEPSVHLHIVSTPAEFPIAPDLIILPGTKNTLADLAWLWHRGVAQQVRLAVKNGSAILGVCGGYQMLGARISDERGVEGEAGTVEPGLGLLPLETSFSSLEEKITRRNQIMTVPLSARGLFASLQDQQFQAYQIHLGRTLQVSENGTPAFLTETSDMDGWLSADGWRGGSYFHGLFENDTFRHGILTALARRHPVSDLASEERSFDRHLEYDKLADFLREHINIHQLKELCRL